MVLSMLLHNFRIESVQKQEELVLMAELILRPENGIRVKLFTRNSKTL